MFEKMLKSYILIVKVKSVKMQIAFTLSEVLITLGIIGIVAAMTLPALIGNYQKHAIRRSHKCLSELKKRMAAWKHKIFLLSAIYRKPMLLMKCYQKLLKLIFYLTLMFCKIAEHHVKE